MRFGSNARAFRFLYSPSKRRRVATRPADHKGEALQTSAATEEDPKLTYCSGLSPLPSKGAQFQPRPERLPRNGLRFLEWEHVGEEGDWRAGV